MATTTGWIDYDEGAAPATPAAGDVRIYAKTDGLLYSKDDAGTETLVSGGTAGAGGAVATDAIWDAAGDLAVGSGANTAARLAIGAAGGAVSVINSAVAWNSGTAFPTAATGDRYWRTDLAVEFYYDGTRWLSTTLYRDTFGVGNAILAATATSLLGRMPPWHTTYDLWLVSLHTTMYVATTNNGTSYWTADFIKSTAANSPTTVATASTAANAADTWVTADTAIGALLAPATYKTMLYQANKVSSPGNLTMSAALTYRLVGV